MNMIELDTTAKSVDASAHFDSSVGDLIAEWAGRVMQMWEKSRRPETAPSSWDIAELGEAYRVRDELNNRLLCGLPAVSICAQRALDTLRAADDLFLRFTVESRTAEALVACNHYARQSEWWWKRLPRATSVRSSYATALA